jgi:hypothetical protein
MSVDALFASIGLAWKVAVMIACDATMAARIAMTKDGMTVPLGAQL